MHRMPHREMGLNLPPLLVLAGRVVPPGLDRVLVQAVRDKAGPLEVLTKVGDKRRIAESDLHRPQMSPSLSAPIGDHPIALKG